MPRAEKKISMWFDWPEDPHGGRVEVTHLTRADEAAIAEQVYEAVNVYNRETGKVESQQKVHTLLDRKLTADAAVSAWENFLDPDGKPMECTQDNKFNWACDREFMAQLNVFRAIVAEEAKRIREQTEKN